MVIFDDLKYAMRLLAKKPGFTLLTVLVMTSGIGISVYLFSIMHPIVFKALPFEDGESLVKISTSKRGVSDPSAINLHDYLQIRTQLEGLTEFGAYSNSVVNVSGTDGARRYNAVKAEPNVFKITRTKPLLGRAFSAQENKTGAKHVTVIGYDMWQNQFGGDINVIHQTLRVNGVVHQIIGVMPKGYTFPNIADMWIPMREDATELARGKAGDFYGMAHLKDGVSINDINRQLTVIMKRIALQYPKTNNGVNALVATFPKTMVGEGIVIVYSMHVISVLILFLASINVGNLLLSRAIEREKETAIRVALGAPRSRLISQMLWESIIICCVGGGVGLLIMGWGLEVTEKIMNGFWVDKPVFWWKFGIDGFTVKIFIVFLFSTILMTGLLPAWKNSGAEFNSVLRDGTRGAQGRRTGRLNRILVISEIFLSMTILIAAGVVIVANYIATHADYGAKTENILTAEVLLADTDYDSPEKQIQFVKAVQSRLENSIAVGDVMIVSALPGVAATTSNFALEGREYAHDTTLKYPRANYIAVTENALKKLDVELKEGRYFSHADVGLDKNTVIVTDSFAQRFLSNQSPIGKRISIVTGQSNEPQWMRIVGVVKHTIQGEADSGEQGKIPTVFRPFSQAPRQRLSIAMVMKTDQLTASGRLREVIESIDPEVPAFRIEPYTEKIARNSAGARLMSTIFLIFGIAAAVLAGSGIYGVMSNTINQRTHEIGVKRSLGALDKRITKEFLVVGFKQLLWGGIPGVVVGCAMGFAMSKTIGRDDATLFIVATIMTITVSMVVLLATYLPTRRALDMEPSAALHCE